MSFPYSPYGLPYPPMPTDQYGAASGAAPSPYPTQYPAMPTAVAPQFLGPPVAAPPAGMGGPPQFIGPPVAAPPAGTGGTPGFLGPPIASYGTPGGTGQPAGYGPGGPADPSVFVHPGSGNRTQFGSGLAATSPGPDVSDGGGGQRPSAVPGGVQSSSDVQTGPRTGAPLLPAADGGSGGTPREIGPAVQKPPASVPNGATPVVGG